MSKKINIWVLIAGAVVGIAAVLLTALGNPANMGFCIACFLRDIAGATKLHSAAVVQYIRPEIIGLVLGSTIIALATGEFKPRAGSSPAVRFILGAIVMIGALVFLGCPLRMVIRMGGGDLNAFVGLVGFAIGILIGIFFLKRGFSLKRSYTVTKTEGFALPFVMVALLALVLIVPSIFVFSESGPGSKHAPVLAALLIALVVGALAQKSRLCMVGGMRDAIMFRDFNLLSGFAAIFVVVLLGNIILGKFAGFSAYLQPIAHASQLWNLLGMVLVGWGSVLLGGCPLRQLILAGEGNGDSAVTVFGMVVGAAVAHNFKLAGSAASLTDGVYSAGGIANSGKIAVVIAAVVLLVISLMNISKKERN
ncbi:MAG: YedE-related selenium metabolism membrane protein [Oscillospiraceae bacterium]|nr:YedE-related selenium metabolism membrane protein [Oscillospiraceae bacterium]